MLAKLTRTRLVLVLEAPEQIAAEGGRERWDLSRAESDVIVCRPCVAGSSEFANTAKRLRMVQALLHWLEVDAFVAWLYARSALAFVRALSPSLVIRDRSYEAWLPSVMAERAASAAAALARAEASQEDEIHVAGRDRGPHTVRRNEADRVARAGRRDGIPSPRRGHPD